MHHCDRCGHTVLATDTHCGYCGISRQPPGAGPVPNQKAFLVSLAVIMTVMIALFVYSLI